jgi:hypothetical protein
MKRSGANAHVLGICCFLCFCFASPGSILAQAAQEPGEAKTAPAVQLIISSKSAQFYAGEIIPLDLVFSSSVPQRYEINNASYDRSGRMGYEQFIVEPKDATRDPLYLYFNSIALFMGGGLSSSDFLTASPKIIHLNLNEWISFDRPGTYRISVVSHRVGDSIVTDEAVGNTVEVKSNWIEIKIVAADPAWQAAELANVRQVLDHSPPSEPNVPNQPREVAIARLRYLGTEPAALEMARRLRGDDGNSDAACMFGLIASPHRDAGLAEMNRLFGNSDFPISQTFLMTMAILPLDPTATPESLRAKMETNTKALEERLMSVLPQKRGKAAATSLETVLSDSRMKASDDVRKQLIPQLIAAFNSLSVDQQGSWLQYRWDAIKDPQWLPTLRAITLRYKDYPERHEMNAYQSLITSGAPLKRWYELDPDAARDTVIKEITRPEPRYGADVLGLLPDKTLPEVEDQLAQHFLATDDYEIEGKIASLLFRYADSDAWPEVAGKVTENVGTWACESQDTMLAYVLRVDPQMARPLLERAIAARGPQDNGCRRTLFTDVGALRTDPILEELAIKSLTDPDPEVARDAASYLGRHGSTAAEQPLWNRYEAWSSQWRGREQEFRFTYAARNPNAEQEGIGERLADALASGLGWLSDETKLRHIAELGIGPNIPQNIDRDLQSWSERSRAIACMPTGVPSSPTEFTLAQYNLHSVEDLKTKLGQFPAGSKFLWSSFEPNTSSECDKAFADASEFATRSGLRLQRVPNVSTDLN